MFDFKQLVFVGAFTGFACAAILGIYHLRIQRAHKKLGARARTRILELSAERTRAMLVAVVVSMIIPVIGRVSADSAPKIEWQDYVSDHGAYTASIPGKPQESVQNLPLPDGTSLELHVLEVDLKSNGNFGISEFAGPKLDYERKDRTDMMNANNAMLQKGNAVTDTTDFPYPAAWGEVPCAETRGHLGSDPKILFLIRSWRTGAHQYSALARYRAEQEPEVKRFLDSIHPADGYTPPGPNHT